MEKKYVAYYKLHSASESNLDLASQQARVRSLCRDGLIVDEFIAWPEEPYKAPFQHALEAARRQKAILIVSNSMSQISRYSFGA